MRQRKNDLPPMLRHGDEWSITKKQAVCAELSRAIKLYFEDNDLVSAHLLASAAGNILRDLAKEAGKAIFRDTLLDPVFGQYGPALIARFNAEYNFFKHGARDPEAVWDHYHPAMTELLLFEVCSDFQNMFGSRYLEIAVFQVWHALRHEDMVKPKAGFREFLKKSSFDLGNVMSDDLREATLFASQMLRESAEVCQRLGLKTLAAEGVQLTSDKDSRRVRKLSSTAS